MEQTLTNFGDFLQENWAVVALVVSEVAALLPGKVRGILQTVVLIGSKIFEKRSKKR